MALVLMAAFTVFYLFNVVNERRAWLWPYRKKGRRFTFNQYVLLLGAITDLFNSYHFVAWTRNWFGQSPAIGFFTGVVYFVNLRWGFRSPFLKYGSSLLKRLKRYDRLYVLNVSFPSFDLVAILPAGAFFKYAYESQIRLFIKHAQFSIATALAKRDERIRNQYSNIKFTEGCDIL